MQVLGMPAYIDTSGFHTPPSVYDFRRPMAVTEPMGALAAQAFSILRFASETGHLVGSVSHVTRRHEIKIGGEVRRHRINFIQAGAPNGLFTMNATGTASGSSGVGGDALATLMIGYVKRLHPLRHSLLHRHAELPDRCIHSGQLAREQQSDA